MVAFLFGPIGSFRRALLDDFTRMTVVVHSFLCAYVVKILGEEGEKTSACVPYRRRSTSRNCVVYGFSTTRCVPLFQRQIYFVGQKKKEKKVRYFQLVQRMDKKCEKMK